MKTVCCAIASFLMIPLIVINIILIIKIYVVKQEVPDVLGFYPLISLTDESSPRIKYGDFILCKKVSLNDFKEGDLVTHIANNDNSAMYVATIVSIEGDKALLRNPDGDETYELFIDDLIGTPWSRTPILGYIIYFLSTIPGFLLFVVIPTIILTEIYLYVRRKKVALADDEWSLLSAEYERLLAERDRLLALLANKGRNALTAHAELLKNQIRRRKISLEKRSSCQPDCKADRQINKVRRRSVRSEKRSEKYRNDQAVGNANKIKRRSVARNNSSESVAKPTGE
ncbi:MAG: hypothetical protein ACI4M6_06450 [Christensenellaceae bacterium]